MLSWKICLVGAFAVGKTSLVKQFVHSIFSDQYLSTVGVKISKKVLTVNEKTVTLMIWDMEGKDNFTAINTSYLKGSSGCFLVADCTRRDTLDDAIQLREFVLEQVGNIPSYMLINKSDLVEQNELTAVDYEKLDRDGIPYINTSAKTGAGVEEAFLSLSRDMMR